MCTRQQGTDAVRDKPLFTSLPLPAVASLQVLLRVVGKSRTRHAVAFMPASAPGGAGSGSRASPSARGRPEVRVVELTPEELLQPFPHLAHPGQVQAPTGQALQGCTLTGVAAHQPSSAGGGDAEDEEPRFVAASQVEDGAKQAEAEAGPAAEGPTLPRPSRPTQAGPAARFPAQLPAAQSHGGGGTSAVPAPSPSPGSALPPALCTTPQRKSSQRGDGVRTFPPAAVEGLATGGRSGGGSAEGSLPGVHTAADSHHHQQHVGQQQELRRAHGGCARVGPGCRRRLRLLSPPQWSYVAGEASGSARMWRQRIEVLVGRGAAEGTAEGTAWAAGAGAGAAGVWVPYSVWEQRLGGQVP